MKGRREFIKGSLAAAGAMVVAGVGRLEAKTTFPEGLVYSKDLPQRWAGKAGLHAPKVTVEDGTVKIVTSHPMTEAHYIVKHTLVTPEGKVLGDKTFSFKDAVAESSFTLPAGFKGPLWATSFCNIHDLWLTEFEA
jgi:superoxide reductase